MAILAANCPCCGRDIGFDEHAKEYTCIFCGAKLITAALVKERLDSQTNAGYERYRKGDADDVRHRSGRRQYAEPKAETASAKPEPAKAEAPAKPAEPEKKEPELTEEEIRVQLMRKAEFKQELRDVVKEIDTLRSRRERFTSQLSVCRTLMIIGLVFIAAAVAVIVFLGEKLDYSLLLAGGLAALGVFTLILSEIKKNSVKKQQKKHEQTIEEKKEKRDILIGRLNKINKHLHIHDGEGN